MTAIAPYYQPAADTDKQTIRDIEQSSSSSADDIGNLMRMMEQGIREPPESDYADIQLAGLLQAVNSATDPYAATPNDAYPPALPYTPVPAATQGKRKRTSRQSSPDATANAVMGDANDGTKRAKHDTPQHAPHPSISAARAAGVHSAAALFRSPASSTAKKYTRPPMSKLYASLHLSPEDFLHLQAAAKSYMLDPEHPQRRDCVGNRAKGDNDMAKLKLFNCVRDFLAEGVGERFFPEHTEGEDAAMDGPGFGDDNSAQQQRWIWPRDANQIVSLVTPLMRRMVTNERQRMYASESRKGGGAPRHSNKGGQAGIDVDGDLLDPKLHEDHLDSSASQAIAAATQPQAQSEHAVADANDQSRQRGAPPSCATNVIQFVFTHKDIKLLRFDWPDPDASPQHAHMTFDKLTRTVGEHAMGIRAAINSAGIMASTRPFAFRPTPQAQLARMKATESLSKARLQQSMSGDVSTQPDLPGTPSAGHTGAADLGEELRRELQSQISQADDAVEQLSHHDATAGDVSLELLGASIKAFTPSGIVTVANDTQWNSVRDETACCVWLEGCLRVAVEML